MSIMIKKNYDTVIAGGGASGIMAAYAALLSGDDTLIVERNNVLGKKLAITGKGRCNITNSADIADFFANIPINANFLYSALYGFTNADLIELLNGAGLRTKVERGGRVFPASDKARDVRSALSRLIKDADIMYNSRVSKVILQDGAVGGVCVGNTEIYADKVIIATGGASYKSTGSTGDGYALARDCGHTITPLSPSLAPLETAEEWVKNVSGLTLKNVKVTVFDKNDKRVYDDFGEMLFTHFGVSGPVILSASSHIRRVDGHYITIDLKPALDERQLDARVIRDFDKYSRRDLINSLDDLLPKNLIPHIVELSKIDPHIKTHQITKLQRAELVKLLKGVRLNIKGMRPLDEAIITSGGISVSEINPSTMESKIISGLYFCGEVIDVDAYTGGFNLQIAFSTGYLAGKTSNK